MARIITVIEATRDVIPVKKKAAAYARVSSPKDAMIHSLEAQAEYYKDYICDNPDWEFVKIYTDEGITGTKERRPGFDEMLADCRAGKIDIIITKSISRFARNTLILLETVRELRAAGIEVYFEEQNINTGRAEGELFLTLLASFAQEESRSVSENVKWRIRKGFEKGELVNLRFLYGYRISKGKVEIYEPEAEVVREIFGRFICGESLGSISRLLNARGLRHTFGGEWSPTRLRELLSNEKYTGNAVFYKTFTNNHIEKKRLRNTGEMDTIKAEGTHEAIIDDETFKMAENILNRFTEERLNRAHATASVYTEKIKCGNCGGNFIHITSRGRRYWNCSTYVKKGKSVCTAKRIPEEVLDSIFSGVDLNTVEKITAYDCNTLIALFTDGTEKEYVWKDRSRSESWTPEMKNAARERMMRDA